MKKLLASIFLCFLLVMAEGVNVQAQETPGWSLTGRSSNGKTIFTVAAERLPQETSSFELTFYLPAGKTVTGLVPLFGKNTATPDCHVVQSEENGRLKTTFYCVSKIGSPIPAGVLLQFEIPGDSKLTKEQITLTGYMLLNQQLKVSASETGTLSYKLGYSENGGQTPGGTTTGGNSAGSGEAFSGQSISKSEETADGLLVRTLTITDPEQETVLQVKLIYEKEDAKPAAELLYYLKNTEPVSQEASDTTLFNAILPKPVIPKEGKEWLAEAGLTEPFSVRAVLPEDTLIRTLKSEQTKQIAVRVLLPDWDEEEFILSNVELPQSVLMAARSEEKTISAEMMNKSKELYSWTFTKEALRNSEGIASGAELLLSAVPISEEEEVFSVLGKDKKYTGGGAAALCAGDRKLPAQAELKLYLPEDTDFQLGKRVYLYQYNQETAKLETLIRSFNYFVEEDYAVTLHVISGQTYVLLPKAAGNSVITALISQISVPKTLELTITEKEQEPVRMILPIKLPDHFEKVTDLEQPVKGSAYGGVTISYKSSNKNVALVGKTGLITAVGEGTAKITTTVTLYSGKTKTFTTTVTVQKEK